MVEELSLPSRRHLVPNDKRSILSRRTWRGLIVLLPLGLSTLANSADRTELWNVVQQCVLLQRLTKLTFPCAAVEQPGPLSIGSVLLKSPRSKTEFLLMPAIAILGLEDPASRTPAATRLWEKAWADRGEIDKIVGHPLPRDQVGLAVNSEMTRTQDQLHIHIECVNPHVVGEVAAVAPPVGAEEREPIRIEGVPYWVITLASDDLSGVDVVGAVAAVIPPPAQNLGATNIAVLGAMLSGGEPGFFVLANTTNTPAEDLLDHDCAAGKVANSKSGTEG